MPRSRFSRWPLVAQLRHGTGGTGEDAMSDRTREITPRTSGASVARSVCPYCAVGCGQLIFHRDGKLVAIEGDPASPISEAISARKAPRATSCSRTRRARRA
jgi:formate dehydrogenase major subunit